MTALILSATAARARLVASNLAHVHLVSIITFIWCSICRKKARRLLRIVSPATVQLRRARVTKASGLLHVLELRAVFERRRDERRAHRMRRVAAIEPKRAGMGPCAGARRGACRCA